MKLSVLIPVCFFTLMPHAYAADAITLKDGEVVQGEIVSETESQVVIKVTNASRTITSQRIIPASDIKDFKPETAQQKEERLAYRALGQLELDPNREYAKADYERGVGAFGKYLKTYPESKYAEEAQQRLAAWKDDLSHLEKGEVKFGNRWMTPEQKRPLWDRFVKEQRVNQSAAYLQSVRQSLSRLESQRNQTVGEIARIETAVQSYQDLVYQYTINPPRNRQPVYETRTPTSEGYDAQGRPLIRTQGLPQRVWVRDEWVRDQGKIDKANTDLANAQAQLGQKRQELVSLEGSINAMRQRVGQAESDYQMANAALQ